MNNLLKLVNTLGKNINNEITIRELSIKSDIPYTTTYRLIKNNLNLFNINQKGNIKLVSLNKEDKLTKNYLIISERYLLESIKTPYIKPLIKELPKEDYCAILFGSRAQGTNRNKSDIDICIVNKDGKKNISFSKFKLIFKLEINPIFLSKKEFISMLKDEEHNITSEIVKKHIILKGEEYFWNMVWENGL